MRHAHVGDTGRLCPSCFSSRLTGSSFGHLRRAVVEALLGLGGNLGDTQKTLDQAVAALCDGSDVRLVARSSDYRTAPWGVTDQPPFVNLALLVDTTLAPRALLKRALSVEAMFGRDRSRELRWGPRILDIDIIAFDAVEINESGLILPHPRLFERAFVLAPLAEIVPDRRIKGIAIKDALARLDQRGIEKLPPRQASAGAS
jgi:2-amino-4-hydroxy-6-hydroxymethyldihydropteridine diphosphokinase